MKKKKRKSEQKEFKRKMSFVHLKWEENLKNLKFIYHMQEK